MSLLSTNTHHLLMEAAATELSTADNVFEDDVESSFERMWSDIPELSAPIFYTEETVPVVKIDPLDEDSPIVVEYDSLAKYMKSNNITDVVEAVNKLQEFYNIDTIGIAVDSYDEACEVMEEAKALHRKGGSKVGLAKVKGSTDILRDLKDKGLHLFKQNGKKKGKK